MAETTLAQPFARTLRLPSGWLEVFAHRPNVLRRRNRRNRYLALTGRPYHRYPWFESLFTSMSGR